MIVAAFTAAGLSPPPDWLGPPDADAAFAEAKISEVGLIENDAKGRRMFDALCQSSEMRKFVARIKVARPDLHKRMDTVFSAKDKKLPKPAGGAA